MFPFLTGWLKEIPKPNDIRSEWNDFFLLLNYLAKISLIIINLTNDWQLLVINSKDVTLSHLYCRLCIVVAFSIIKIRFCSNQSIVMTEIFLYKLLLPLSPFLHTLVYKHCMKSLCCCPLQIIFLGPVSCLVLWTIFAYFFLFLFCSITSEFSLSKYLWLSDWFL